MTDLLLKNKMDTTNQEMTKVINLAGALAPATIINPEMTNGPLDICRRLQPMGKRIIVKQPYLSDESSPIFAIRIDPIVPHPESSLFPVDDPVYILPANKFNPILTTPSVTCVTYDVPPPISPISLAYRYWSGEMIYSIRTISSAISQGYLIFGIARAKHARDIIAADATNSKQNVWREIIGIKETFQSFMMESYNQVDLSLYRHCQVRVPFNRSVDMVDIYKQYAARAATYNNAAYTAEDACDFLVCGIRGATSTNVESAELTFEIEMAGGFDFMLYERLNVQYDLWNQSFSLPYVFPYVPIQVPKKKKTRDGEHLPSLTTLSLSATPGDVSIKAPLE